MIYLGYALGASLLIAFIGLIVGAAIQSQEDDCDPYDPQYDAASDDYLADQVKGLNNR